MGRGQGRPQRLYSGVERRLAISMKSKKKFMILWVLLIAVLFAGSLLTAPPGKTETIQTAMRDAVLHEENQISLFGWKNVNPGLISAMTVSAILLIAAACIRVFVIPKFKVVPGRFQLLLEHAVSLFDGMARTMEPALAETVRGALLAPTAAIVDPWGLCLAAAETAVRNGAELKRGSAVAGVEDLGDHYVVHTASGNYESRYLVNCAGVHGHEISAMVGESEWMPKHSRGEYYLLDKSSGDLVNHVIFQCPSVLGKGVLVAPTVHGNLIVGPNAEPVEDGDDRATTQSGLDQVAAFGRKSVPSIDLRQSIRNFSGVRAVTSEEDFIIRPAKNSPRMLYVCGIKSPGLSAAPAIADYALEKLKEMGLAAEKKTMWSGKRTQIRFRKLSDSEKAELVRKDPRYGRIICRCETITEGEIIAAIHSPIPPCSIDGVKRRTGAGMGRCQGGFCGPRVLKILADELGKDPMEIVQDGSATWLLMEETKGGSGK